MSRQLIWRALLLVALLASGCDEVGFVDRVVIVNDTSYTASVEVSGEAGGWVALTTVSPGATREVREVIDQGDEWTFRFAYAGHEPVEMTVVRSDLASAGWRIQVPDELEQSLRGAGVAPPPSA